MNKICILVVGCFYVLSSVGAKTIIITNTCEKNHQLRKNITKIKFAVFYFLSFNLNYN